MRTRIVVLPAYRETKIMTNVMRLAITVLIAALFASSVHAASSEVCHEGAYRLADGRTIVLAPSAEGSLRYRSSDGATGHLYRKRGNSDGGVPGWASRGLTVATGVNGVCDARDIAFIQGPNIWTATRVALDVKNITFRSGSNLLRGRLVVPASDAQVPLIVYVHGSETSSAVDNLLDQYMSPAHGVAAFVFDKRGTGQSEGSYTQDFKTLAGDAISALTAARELMGKRVSKAGFVGHSQGGWVAPLAATKTNADFVVAAYGLAISPRAEDAAQVQYELERKGYGAAVLRAAAEVTDATAEVMTSGFKRGFDKVAAAKRRYGKEPWFKVIKGEYSGVILRYPAFLLKLVGPRRDKGTPWDYDPLPTLRAVDRPMLWVLAGADDEAPSISTQLILGDLQVTHPNLDVAVYPGTTHGIRRFTEDETGKRTHLGYAPSYQFLVLEWVKTGRLITAADVELRPGTRSTRRQF